MTPSSQAAQILQKAVALHQAGQLEDASLLYMQVLKVEPFNANALKLLGVIAHHGGRMAEAEALFRRALASAPTSADTYFHLGNLLAARGNSAKALESYAKAAALDAALADAHLNAGVLLHREGRYHEAIAAFRRAAALRPRDAAISFNISRCFHALSQSAEEERALKHALALDPNYVDALEVLAALYSAADRLDEAIALTRSLVTRKPLPGFYSNLGDLLRQAGDLDAALEMHGTAIAAAPDDPLVLHNHGAALHAADRYAEARDVFLKILCAHPEFVAAHIGLTKIYEHEGRHEEAIAALERALAIDPSSSTVKFKLSLQYLLTGDFEKGWPLYEQRFATADKPLPLRATPPLYWEGEDLRDKAILLWAEQGLGDEILYSGLIPEIAARAGRCILECAPRMAPVFRRSFPQVEVMAIDGARSEVPKKDVDYQSALASLPRFLRPNFASFPDHQGYLKADAKRAVGLRARYQALTPGNLIVGLSWRSANADLGGIKSSKLSHWGDILRVAGVTFVNLQYGDCVQDLAEVRSAFGVSIYQDDSVDPLRDMDAFFAQVAAMDLVISTSNTTAHVTGSLNIPTWLLLSGHPGALWYWFQNRTDSPWYPALKIFRGEAQGADLNEEFLWENVISRAAARLAGSHDRARAP